MPLPTFLIAGERRCGTSALAIWMSSHPDIYIRDRDPQYFCDSAVVGRKTDSNGDVDWERWDEEHSLAEYEQLFAEGASFRLIAEKTADYLFWHPSHQRISRYLPEVKIILILRNPIERAWSHYWNEVPKGRETLGFEAALAAENERSKASAYARYHLSYQQRGFYDESIQRLYQVFEPNRVKIVTLEQFQEAPASILKGLYEFLEVDPNVGLEKAGEQYNKNWALVLRPWVEGVGLAPLARQYETFTRRVLRRLIANRFRQRELHKVMNRPFFLPADKKAMRPETRRLLTDVFRPHVDELAHILDRPLTEWPAFQEH